MTWRVIECDECTNRIASSPSLTFTCGLVLCGFCARRKWARTTARWTYLIEDFRSPKLVTLTFRTVRFLRPSSLDRARDCLGKLLRRKLFSRARAALYAIEIKPALSGGWNLHIHLIADVPFIPQQVLSYTWGQITGDSRVVDIRAISNRASTTSRDISPEKAVRKVLRYILKPPSLSWRDEAVIEYFRAIRGRRLREPLGAARGKAKLLDRLQREGGVLWDPLPPSCPICGGTSWTTIGVFHLTQLRTVLRPQELPTTRLRGPPVMARGRMSA